jgi:restriction system protein
MEKTEVNAAFEILLEEVESVGNTLNEAGADAFRKGDYELARRVIEDATRLTGFREKLKSLQKEWQQGFAGKASAPFSGAPRIKRKIDKRLTRGLRTPEEAFRLPLLQALKDLGGSAPMNDVMNTLEKKLKSTLTPYDYQPLPSNPKQMRWKNTVQWCRLTLVTEGLMKNDSSWGIWEISQAGIAALKRG